MDYNSLTRAQLNSLTLDQLDTLRKKLNQVERKDLYKKLDEDRLADLSEHISTNIDDLRRDLCKSLNLSIEKLEKIIDNLKMALFKSSNLSREELKKIQEKIIDLVVEENSLEEIIDSDIQKS